MSTLSREERICNIVETLRPTDPDSWPVNILYVTAEFDGYDSAQRDILRQREEDQRRTDALMLDGVQKIEELREQLAASLARCAELEGWLKFIKQDYSDDGLYESQGEPCVDFYRNCDMALEGKPIPTERPPA